MYFAFKNAVAAADAEARAKRREKSGSGASTGEYSTSPSSRLKGFSSLLGNTSLPQRRQAISHEQALESVPGWRMLCEKYEKVLPLYENNTELVQRRENLQVKLVAANAELKAQQADMADFCAEVKGLKGLSAALDQAWRNMDDLLTLVSHVEDKLDHTLERKFQRRKANLDERRQRSLHSLEAKVRQEIMTSGSKLTNEKKKDTSTLEGMNIGQEQCEQEELEQFLNS